ncbi:type II secretion system protein [bacterium]|nr:type II secretion system protein [bacterium]
MSLFSKKSGFTLAEILITLGLIGCISALTLPTLSYNYRAKVLEQRFRSTYSELKEIGAMINLEHGDLGDFAYKCVYQNNFHCGAQTNESANVYSGAVKWGSEILMRIHGGSPYNDNVYSGNGNIAQELKNIYKNAGAPQGPFRFSGNYAGVVCDNGGIWTDSKGRIWSFNGENELICVDINGTSPPNKLNIDIFGFIPMTAAQASVWVYNDTIENAKNYSGQFVSCNLEKIYADGTSNNVPVRNPDPSQDRQKGFFRGSGSALDSCPFNEPIENIAPVGDNGRGTNARGKTVTRSNNYWKDYINYR